MRQEFYITDKGIVVRDNDSIRVKSTFIRTHLSEEEFVSSNPIKINKNVYLAKLNEWFSITKHEWEFNGVKFKKLPNFEKNSNLVNIPRHDLDAICFESCMIVLYHGRLYYTFISGNYYPQMQLIDFYTKKLTGKWTNIKNLAPIFNCETKQII